MSIDKMSSDGQIDPSKLVGDKGIGRPTDVRKKGPGDINISRPKKWQAPVAEKLSRWEKIRERINEICTDLVSSRIEKASNKELNQIHQKFTELKDAYKKDFINISVTAVTIDRLNKVKNEVDNLIKQLNTLELSRKEKGKDIGVKSFKKLSQVASDLFKFQRHLTEIKKETEKQYKSPKAIKNESARAEVTKAKKGSRLNLKNLLVGMVGLAGLTVMVRHSLGDSSSANTEAGSPNSPQGVRIQGVRIPDIRRFYLSPRRPNPMDINVFFSKMPHLSNANEPLTQQNFPKTQEFFGNLAAGLSGDVSWKDLPAEVAKTLDLIATEIANIAFLCDVRIKELEPISKCNIRKNDLEPIYKEVAALFTELSKMSFSQYKDFIYEATIAIPRAEMFKTIVPKLIIPAMPVIISIVWMSILHKRWSPPK